jgi:rhodanese-related sulfurtransferase
MLSKLKQLLRPSSLAPGPLRWIECADLAARMTCETLTIIDVRGADEFNGPLGHIDGAVLVPVDDIVAGRADIAGLREREIVLVCRTDRRSARAADSLRASGFARVMVLRGGMESWNSVGLPVTGRRP